MPSIPQGEHGGPSAVPGPDEILLSALGQRDCLPWLFYPRGMGWEWRSWRQIVDQVARGVRELRRFGGPSAVEVPTRLDPDGIAALWASLVSGCEVGAAAGGARAPGPGTASRWVFPRRSEPSSPGPLCPAARSRLEPWVPTLPEAAGAPGRLVHHRPDGQRRPLVWEEILRRADHLLASLRRQGAEGERPIFLVAGGLDGLAEQIALVATARMGSPLALEPRAEALAGSVARLRPEVLVAPPSALPVLEGHLDSRWTRRWSRLRAVVVPSGGGAGDEKLRAALAGLPLVEGPWRLDEVGDRR